MDQEIVTTVNELQIIICEEFQTCSMNQSCMRSETEVSGSSFEVQQTLFFVPHSRWEYVQEKDVLVAYFFSFSICSESVIQEIKSLIRYHVASQCLATKLTKYLIKMK